MVGPFARFRLWHYILIGMGVGTGLGAALSALPATSLVRKLSFDTAGTIGEVFIRLITMVMVPLVIASLVVGMGSLGDPKRLGRIGVKALSFFFATTAIAVTLGLLAVNVIRPGERLPPERATELKAIYAAEAAARGETASAVQSTWTVFEFVKGLVPKNVVEAMAKGEMLPVIAFALLLGLAALLLPEDRSKPFFDFMRAFNDIMLKMVEVIMWTAPVGVLALMIKVIVASGLSILVVLGYYGLTVVLALAVHFLVVYPLALKLFSPLSPRVFFRALREVHLTAFSTSSSAATLPVNIHACERNLGIPPRIAGFILPLGATTNMDGTALYQGVAAIFIAQVYGLDLGLGAQLTIVLTATVASIGAAPVPGAGMVMLAVIMTPLGIPIEGLALIFGIDRFLDMCRTVVNVTGDATCTVIIAASEGESIRPIV